MHATSNVRRGMRSDIGLGALMRCRPILHPIPLLPQYCAPAFMPTHAIASPYSPCAVNPACPILTYLESKAPRLQEARMRRSRCATRWRGSPE
ncbi:hypothetical protein JB92DRAFT_3009686 [Gautieria morchelliformis]|nr:hypothetical protein JB92DRAFT_3009686 [Gautieria morchelliformis]